MEKDKSSSNFYNLEAYQNTYQAGIKVIRNILPKLPKQEKFDLDNQLCRSTNAVRRLIAEAYSKRYQKKGYQSLLDDAAEESNECIVSLSQVRDIYNIESDLCAQLIDIYDKSSRQLQMRSFCDLEGYQRTAEFVTEVMIKIVSLLEGDSSIKEKLVNCGLRIPQSIASAHSHRFETGEELRILDSALEDCNEAVVYLEQAGDIFKDIEGKAVCEGLIKCYILIRREIFNLYKAWRKFEPQLSQKFHLLLLKIHAISYSYGNNIYRSFRI